MKRRKTYFNTQETEKKTLIRETIKRRRKSVWLAEQLLKRKKNEAYEVFFFSPKFTKTYFQCKKSQGNESHDRKQTRKKNIGF